MIQSMTVRDLQAQFILGQKWAVEVCQVKQNEDGILEDSAAGHLRFEYETGKTAHCPYFDSIVDYVRCIGDTITICVSEVI